MLVYAREFDSPMHMHMGLSHMHILQLLGSSSYSIRVWDSPICIPYTYTVAAGQQQLQYTHMGQSYTHICIYASTATVYTRIRQAHTLMELFHTCMGLSHMCICMHYLTVPCMYERGQHQQQQQQQHAAAQTINLNVKKYNMQNKICSQLANYIAHTMGQDVVPYAYGRPI